MLAMLICKKTFYDVLKGQCLYVFVCLLCLCVQVSVRTHKQVVTCTQAEGLSSLRTGVTNICNMQRLESELRSTLLSDRHS